jgi:predicted PurR-regulated permease PerM
MFVFACFLLFALRGFINIFLGALIIYVLFKPIMQLLSVKLKWNKSVSAIIIILISFVIVLVPIFFVGKLLYSRISNYLNPDVLNQSLSLLNEKSKTIFGLELVNPENIKTVQLKLTSILTDILNQTATNIWYENISAVPPYSHPESGIHQIGKLGLILTSAISIFMR